MQGMLFYLLVHYVCILFLSINNFTIRHPTSICKCYILSKTILDIVGGLESFFGLHCIFLNIWVKLKNNRKDLIFQQITF